METRIHVYGDGRITVNPWSCEHDDHLFVGEPAWWWYDATEGPRG